MKERFRSRVHPMSVAFSIAEKLRQAGLSAEDQPDTAGEYMAKVRIHLGDTDCRHLCVYSGSNGTKYRTHEMKGPDLSDVIEACWNDHINVARGLLGYVGGAHAPGDEGVPDHAYIASHGSSRLSNCAIAVAAGDDFKGYVDSKTRANHLVAQAEGVMRLIWRCADRGIDRVAIHAGVEILKLAAGISEPSNRILKNFVGAVQSGTIGIGTIGIVWLPIDETSKGHRAALKRAKRIYEKRRAKAA